MLICSHTAGNGLRGIETGSLAFVRIQQGSTTSGKKLILPPNLHGIPRIGCHENYGNRQYLVGGWTENLVIDEEFRVSHQGMRAPDALPSVAVGGGTTLQICYTRFFDEVTGERSPLSDGKSVTGNTSRAWTNLPTEVPNERIVVEGTVTVAAGSVTGVKSNFTDLRPGYRIADSTALTRYAQILTISGPTSMTIDDAGMAIGAGGTIVCKPVSRASHVELWVSVDGALPRLAARVRIGVTAFSEAVATGALGIAETTSFEPMRRGEISIMYHDRQAVAGVDGARDTIFLSAVGLPERHEGLRMRTKYNEPIIGMMKFKDYVVVLCPKSSYRMQGYTEDDYTLEVLDPKTGGLGHHCNVSLDNIAYIPGRYGVNLFNGAFHKGMSRRRSEWVTDYVYGVDITRRAYEEGFAFINQNDETFQFYPRFGSDAELAWVGHYGTVTADVGGALVEPYWTDDAQRIKPDTYAAYATIITFPGEKSGKLHLFGNDAKIYTESLTTAFNGTTILVGAHRMFGDPGGDDIQGHRLNELWSYALHEDSAMEVRVHPGSQYCLPPDTHNTIPNEHVAPFIETWAATHVETGPAPTRIQEPQIVHPMKPDLESYGFTIEHRFTNPLNVRFIGYSMAWGPGGGEQAGEKVFLSAS